MSLNVKRYPGDIGGNSSVISPTGFGAGLHIEIDSVEEVGWGKTALTEPRERRRVGQAHRRQERFTSGRDFHNKGPVLPTTTSRAWTRGSQPVGRELKMGHRPLFSCS